MRELVFAMLFIVPGIEVRKWPQWILAWAAQGEDNQEGSPMSSTPPESSTFADIAANAAQAQAEIIAASQHADPERADLLAELASSRHFLRYTTRDLTDEQARQRTTASELCLSGLIKHLIVVEETWGQRFLTEGATAMRDWSAMTPADFEGYASDFRLLPGETLAGVLDDYAKASAATDEVIRSVPDLNAGYPLPNAPWFPPGATWTVRRAILHVISETSQHAGHADIIRESLDGSKSMG